MISEASRTKPKKNLQQYREKLILVLCLLEMSFEDLFGTKFILFVGLLLMSFRDVFGINYFSFGVYLRSYLRIYLEKNISITGFIGDVI